MKQVIHILGGGTFNHVRNHLALAAPAFGETAMSLYMNFVHQYAFDENVEVVCHLTRMAEPTNKLAPVTNDDVSELLDVIIADPTTRCIVFNVALCDFIGTVDDVPSGKYAERLKSREVSPSIKLTMADKLLSKIRKTRKDIFLVGFKTTCGASESDQYLAGLNLLKANSCNLVLANDTKTRLNMVIVPEESRYHVTNDRDKVLVGLVDIISKRLNLHFTRSTVVPGDSVDWNSEIVPESLRAVVNHCIKRGAYKQFRGVTAGHFAYKVNDNEFVTSKRKTNFNNLDEVGLVKVVSSGPDSVIAYGARPSVGGQSQRIVFAEHQDVDCIVHFHCPTKPTADVSVRSQYEFECGSHECGKNTSDGLRTESNGIKAVYLDSHGPNIVFNKNIDPALVIDFIEKNFDLEQKTGGLVS